MRLALWLSPLVAAVAVVTADSSSTTTTTTTPVVRARRLNYFKDSVVDGLETEYNEYAQSWRYLGLYVDCQTAQQQKQNRQRDLEEQQNQEQCQRYLLWAAVSTYISYLV
jgi:hypothetical protein